MTYHYRDAPTDRQLAVLAAARKLYGDRMDNRPATMRALAAAVGHADHWQVRYVLFALRAKGLIATEGRMASRPDVWVLSVPCPNEQDTSQDVSQDTSAAQCPPGRIAGRNRPGAEDEFGAAA